MIPIWTSAFWTEANRVARAHHFEIRPGNHKDHYRLHARRRGADRKACLAAFTAAGLPGGWVS
jgi:hypothetical protein